MKQMVQIQGEPSSNSPSILPAKTQAQRVPALQRSLSSASLSRNPNVVKGAAYSHADLRGIQSNSISRSTSPMNGLHTTKHVKSSTKFSSLLQDTDDDWATEIDDSGRAAERRQQTMIKSIEHRPASFEHVSMAPLKKTHSYPQYPLGTAQGGLRQGFEKILNDTSNLLDPQYLPTAPEKDDSETDSMRDELASRCSRIDRFKRILAAPNTDLSALRKLAWNGVPGELRPLVWQLLLGYLPLSKAHRASTLARKRKEFTESVQSAFGVGEAQTHRRTKSTSKGLDQVIWHQIHIDVPRTNPLIRLYQFPSTQRSLERILYIWAIRHPASGYVQGINDLLTPFFQVFLGSYLDCPVENFDPTVLPNDIREAIEADSFWCLSKLLDGIQDNYIHSQPGIIRQVNSLRDLTNRIDASLVSHLDAEGVEFIQFSFRWMNCLLMRELSLPCVTRMWDTYMSELDGFSDFHLYVCTAFLVKFSSQIMQLDFQGIMMFVQALPTQLWTDKDVEMLLSEAYLWKSLWSRNTNFVKR